MKRILIVFAIIAVFAVILCRQFIYKPGNVSKVVLCVDYGQYEIPNEIWRIWVSDLSYSWLYRDAPSCGFDDSFSMDFFDDQGNGISRLLIAQDGCGTFKVDDTNLYIEGKDKVREQIDEYLCTMR